MIHSPLDIIYSCIWQSTPLKDILPLACCALHQLFLNQRLQLRTMIHSIIVADEARVSGPFELPELVTEDSKETVIGPANKYISISSPESLVGNNRSWKRLSVRLSLIHPGQVFLTMSSSPPP